MNCSDQKKSFVIRQGRLKPTQRSIIEQSVELDCVIQYDAKSLDCINTNRALIVEIGFGVGGAFCQMAKDNEAFEFLGIEVYPKGFASCAIRIDQEALRNAHVIRHDAVEVVENCIQPASVDQFNIYQPDPWPKKRHHKRRLLQKDFLKLLLSRLKRMGRIHITTDHQEYAQSIQEQLDLCGDDLSYDRIQQRPHFRPVTKYETIGQKQGHTHSEFMVHNCLDAVVSSRISQEWPERE